MDTNTQELANIFDIASADIDKYGWRRHGAALREHDPRGSYRRCLWVALIRVLERINAPKTYSHDAAGALLVHMGYMSLCDVFWANDRYDGTDAEGKAWAVNLLHEVATELRGANAQTLVAGPVIDSIK